MWRNDPARQILILFLLLHLTDQVEDLFEFWRLLFDVYGENGKQIMIILVPLEQFNLQSITDFVDLSRGRSKLITFNFIRHKLSVLLSDLFFFLLGSHERQFSSLLFVHQRIDEEVQKVNFVDICHKFFDVRKEL